MQNCNLARSLQFLRLDTHLTSVKCDCNGFAAVKARLQPFTVLFSFSAILVCFIDAQIHSFFLDNMSEFERQ